MNIQSWLKARRTVGTTACLARRLTANETVYASAERRLRQMYILEALIKHDGNHDSAAASLKVHRHTIGRCLKALGLTSDQVREIAKQITSTKEATKCHQQS